MEEIDVLYGEDTEDPVTSITAGDVKDLLFKELEDFLHSEIVERRDYSASKSFEVVLEKIKELEIYNIMAKDKGKLIEDMILKQFDIIGVEMTMEKLLTVDEFYRKYSMTEKQEKEWETYCLHIFAKKFRYPKKWAHKEYSMLNLNYGLTIKE